MSTPSNPDSVLEHVSFELEDTLQHQSLLKTSKIPSLIKVLEQINMVDLDNNKMTQVNPSKYKKTERLDGENTVQMTDSYKMFNYPAAIKKLREKDQQESDMVFSNSVLKPIPKSGLRKQAHPVQLDSYEVEEFQPNSNRYKAAYAPPLHHIIE